MNGGFYLYSPRDGTEIKGKVRLGYELVQKVDHDDRGGSWTVEKTEGFTLDEARASAWKKADPNRILKEVLLLVLTPKDMIVLGARVMPVKIVDRVEATL